MLVMKRNTRPSGRNIKIFLKGSLLIIILILLNCISSKPESKLSPQNPSPMAEHIRQHERIPDKNLPGNSFAIDSLLHKSIEIFIPAKAAATEKPNLLIHFHGASYVAKYAVSVQTESIILANVHLGAGSSSYERPFSTEKIFDDFIAALHTRLKNEMPAFENFDSIYISSFSAGYGAVRAIIKYPENMNQIDGIILLDGLHTDYIPARTPLAKGGALNTTKLENFLKFAELAASGERRMIITHSEIFPGTYASTTETAEYLVRSLNLKRKPVLKWGPMGMQQVSETVQNDLHILTFVGNTAPDHIDHFHALHNFLSILVSE